MNESPKPGALSRISDALAVAAMKEGILVQRFEIEGVALGLPNMNVRFSAVVK